MASDDIALSIKHVSKDFKLPHENHNSLKEKILHLGKKTSYDMMHALHDINVDVKRGEFFGIVGRNGSGKSTLLKIIGGIYQPTKGSVTVNGTLTPFIELGIGFNPELTGRDNVFLNGAILGLTRKEMVELYDEIVAFAELEKFMDQKLKNYSSGMQVRLAFSIAIRAHNDILLIDEVLAVGDTNFQRKCFEVFKGMKKTGKTVIFVTHDMHAVQEYCDRAMMIQDSEMLMIGNPREVALRYEVANMSAARQEAGEKTARPQNPDIKIESIKVRSATRNTNSFKADEDIVVDVNIVVKKPTDIQLNAYFVRSDGRYVAGLNTTSDLKAFQPGLGKHILTCTFKAGQIVKGEYRINAAIYTYGDAAELIDVIDSSYGVDTPRVSILEPSLTQDGDFYVQGKWQKAR